jgi:hypothetical protein
MANSSRIELSYDDCVDGFARCDCYQEDKFITVFFAPPSALPLRSELMKIIHPLFEWSLRETEG